MAGVWVCLCVLVREGERKDEEGYRRRGSLQERTGALFKAHHTLVNPHKGFAALRLTV